MPMMIVYNFVYITPHEQASGVRITFSEFPSSLGYGHNNIYKDSRVQYFNLMGLAGDMGVY